MDANQFIRDKEKVHAALFEKGDSLFAKKPIKLYVPTRFEERGLASIGIDTFVCGIIGIVVEDKYYASWVFNAIIQIEPQSTIKVNFGDNEYYEFSFDAGAVICKDLNLIRTDTLVFRIYDEILSKGKVPWYMNYEAMGKLFSTSRKHADTRVGDNREVTELIISMNSRNPKNLHQYYREIIRQPKDLEISPVFTALKDVDTAATNTLNKLAGSYFEQGVTSALVNPADRQERIESLLTK